MKADRWTFAEALDILNVARAELPEWRLALHGSVLSLGAGRDLDLIALRPPGASADDLPCAMGAAEIVTNRPDKRRFLLSDGRCVDVVIASRDIGTRAP